MGQVTDAAAAGYDAYYSFCRVRSGYSGVVTFCKDGIPIVAAEEGLCGSWKTADAVGSYGSAHENVGCCITRHT